MMTGIHRVMVANKPNPLTVDNNSAFSNQINGYDFHLEQLLGEQGDYLLT